MTACMVHKELISAIGDTFLLEKDLPLETLKAVDMVVMVGAVDKVDVGRVVVVVEEVDAGVEATLKTNRRQSKPKLPKMKLISSLIPFQQSNSNIQ